MAEVLDEAGIGMTEGGAWQADRGSQDLHLLCLCGKRIDLSSPRARAFPLSLLPDHRLSIKQEDQGSCQRQPGEMGGFPCAPVPLR